MKSLMAELDQVRADGYAVAASTRNPGVVGIAAPVLGGDERAVASISLTGPESRLLGAKKEKLIESLRHACGAASEPLLTVR